MRWLRPHEVTGADASSIDLIKDGLTAGDVVQGELGDCYLLGAMSSIAARNLLVTRVPARLRACPRRLCFSFGTPPSH